jgi:hypothetical protein
MFRSRWPRRPARILGGAVGLVLDARDEDRGDADADAEQGTQSPKLDQSAGVTSLHRKVRAGTPMAQALWEARTAADLERAEDYGAWSGVTAYGAA